jgi:hypothetical protein
LGGQCAFLAKRRECTGSLSLVSISHFLSLCCLTHKERKRLFLEHLPSQANLLHEPLHPTMSEKTFSIEVREVEHKQASSSPPQPSRPAVTTRLLPRACLPSKALSISLTLSPASSSLSLSLSLLCVTRHTHHAQFSKSGRSACKKCKEHIAKDEMRVGQHTHQDEDKVFT